MQWSRLLGSESLVEKGRHHAMLRFTYFIVFLLLIVSCKAAIGEDENTSPATIAPSLRGIDEEPNFSATATRSARSTNVSVAATGVASARITDDWLTDSNCYPPCWNGMIPGQTDIQSATRQLENQDFIGISERQEQRSGEIELSWRGRGVEYGRALFSAETGVLESILLVFYDDIRLEEITKYFGEPSQVEVSVATMEHEIGRINYYYTLYYASDGFSVSGRLLELDSSALELRYNSINEIRFFVAPDPISSDISVLRRYSGSTNGRILSWEPNEDFGFYCRETYMDSPSTAEMCP